MFPKNSVFAVVALATFVSLGALLFPQVVQAQPESECLWNCVLGSDANNEPAENSPQFTIVYCFDQPCVASLGIFRGVIPNANVQQCPSKFDDRAKVEKCLTDFEPPKAFECPANIMITGNVVAVLRDRNGNLRPESAAEASLFMVVKGVDCGPGNPPSTLSRVVDGGEDPGAVFARNSNLTILAHSSQPSLASPNWGGTGCPTDKKGILTANCSFPLGIDMSVEGLEVYHGEGFGRVVSMRMCKGDANKPSSSIACTVDGNPAVGGFTADAVFVFDGNWLGIGDKKFNPNLKTGAFVIITPLFDDIVLTDPAHPVTASANGGTPIPAQFCHPIRHHETLLCFFSPRDLLPNGCTKGEPVNVLVGGNVFSADARREVKFVSQDDPICNTKSFHLGDLFGDLLGLIRK
jgi:hypothetical protein